MTTTTQFGFPHSTLTPIVGKPTLATLTLLKSELYANAMVTECELGGGDNGYLALVMSPAEYAMQPGTIPFIEPINPGAQPAHGNAATAPQMTEANRRHDYDVERYSEYKAIKNELKLQLISAVHPTFIAILRDPIFGLAKVTARDIISHLTTTYGNRTIEDLEANRNQVMAEWDPDTEIEHLWTRATACKIFAEGTTLALSDDAIMNLLLVSLEKTKVFEEDIKAWRILPLATQTWAAFTEHFTARNKERTRKLNTGKAGYNALAAVTSGLSIQETHSANAATVTSTPSTTTATSRRSDPNVATISDDIGTLKLYYCHSCGFGQYKNHTSVSCNKPKPGHKTEATARNMMGGTATVTIRTRPAGKRTGGGANNAAPTTPSLG